MSDAIKHECGIALVRLLKPLSYYQEKYGTPFYGIKRLYLLMQKQHNRGQDGAGIANIKIDVPPGTRYISRTRAVGNGAIQEIFERINKKIEEVSDKNPHLLKDTEWLYKNMAFTGEVLLGHLRYGTYGGNSIENCHPFLRQNNWRTRNLVVAGNFNLTNVDELFEHLIELGQHPKEKRDTVTVMEKIGHFLDVENERLFKKFKKQKIENSEISTLIAEQLSVKNILKDASKKWDGGYAMAGIVGHGDAFVLRDPNGIRPAFYYANDEIVVVASERPAIQTVFNVPIHEIKEIDPGNALIIKCNGEYFSEKIINPGVKSSCSFERIYFSRGNDAGIYNERKTLGKLLSNAILKEIDGDLRNTVFSFIPNTAETAFYGLIEGLTEHLNQKKLSLLKNNPSLSEEEIKNILSEKPRVEKIAIKDAKLRTFITEDTQRDDFVAHVYDTTYGIIHSSKDTLVVLDDSIVRGTTLKRSILRILDRLSPKKIVIVSSAPQIRFPDCYGIDMAKLGDFVAFQALVALLKENFKENLLEEAYEKAKAMDDLPKNEIVNVIAPLYDPFTYEQISSKIAELIRPPDLKAQLSIVFQSLSNLHLACPNNKGDWYFSGNYPTPGGNKVVNRSFINYMEGKNVRAY